jgi:hypothetical protein
MLVEPLSCSRRHSIQGAWFFKQVCSARYDFEPVFRMTRKLSYCRAVEIQNLTILSPDDKQSRCENALKGGTGQIRPASARDHGLHSFRAFRGCNQRRCCSRAGSEISKT